MVKKLRVKLSTSPLQVVQTNDAKGGYGEKNMLGRFFFHVKALRVGFGSVVASFAPLNFSYLLL